MDFGKKCKEITKTFSLLLNSNIFKHIFLLEPDNQMLIRVYEYFEATWQVYGKLHQKQNKASNQFGALYLEYYILSFKIL